MQKFNILTQKDKLKIKICFNGLFLFSSSCNMIWQEKSKVNKDQLCPGGLVSGMFALVWQNNCIDSSKPKYL